VVLVEQAKALGLVARRPIRRAVARRGLLNRRGTSFAPSDGHGPGAQELIAAELLSQRPSDGDCVGRHAQTSRRGVARLRRTRNLGVLSMAG